MLILTLSRGRSIDITLEDGRRIEIHCLGADSAHLRLGFDAPKSILIDRHVVTERKARENGNCYHCGDEH